MRAIRISIHLVLTAICLPAIEIFAQHYPAGSEGIKDASLPLPGFYIKDYNSFYYAGEMPGFNRQFEKGFNAFTYTQAPRLIWMTPWRFLGADYGVAMRLPFAYKQATHRVATSTGGFPSGSVEMAADQFGLADMQIEPLIFSWHLKHFDIISGYSLWVPTGDYNKKRFFLLNLGNGDWTHMFTLGATWYPNEEKTWAISLLNRYEINTVQYSDLYGAGVRRDTTPGDDYTLEWALSKTIRKNVDVGITGYYQQQMTDTQGPTFMDARFHVAGIGPEVVVAFPKLGLDASLRYAYEFASKDHPQGHLTTLSLTKSF
jgi:hypothetical protein